MLRLRGYCYVADSPNPSIEPRLAPVADLVGAGSRSYSFRECWVVLRRRRRFLGLTVGGLLLLCLAYCLVAPNQYEASARVELRMQASSSLSLEAAAAIAPASILSTPLQLETLVNVMRSEQLAWRVITGLKLYEAQGFVSDFGGKFPAFDAAKPASKAQSYLLDRFAKRLQVRTLPRTLLIEIRFRSKDPALAAAVVNELIHSFVAIESETRVDATSQASGWLSGQLKDMTAQVELKERRLAEFERQHGFTTTQQTIPGGQSVETLHDPTALQVDEVGRLLAVASGDRILREALYREARLGNPEQVLVSNPDLQAEMGPGGAALAQKLRTNASEVAVELAQLKAEHGPNYPRVVELERAQADIDGQIKVEDGNLVEAFHRTWKAAADREKILRVQLDARVAEGLRQNDATIQYSVLHEQVESGRELCSRLQKRIQEAALSAGVHASSILVVDWAREPYKPVAPDLSLYMAITLFVGFWVAVGGALLVDALRPDLKGAGLLLMLALAGATGAPGQAPTPNTQGLPSGVVKLPQSGPEIHAPNAREAPPIWNSAVPGTLPNAQDQPVRLAGMAMALPIGVGDFLEVSEFHTPEFRSAVRVAADGTVLLPLVGPVLLRGMSEQEASRAIEKAFLDTGMLLHPQVSVLVTNAVGQDVSVMGEVARPGVYPYTVHHRLLDLISAASGLSPNAGRLVSVFHRDDSKTPHPFVLDPSGIDSKVEHNPELAPGDTVLVSRAGLVYVIGDVVRPGGFAVDPVQGLTIVQALSLAWGATPNAAVGKAILIRDQPGGRTLTTLNLRRMIRGQDPDQPVRDRDILFVPDSATKTLLNKSLESAIQSAIGVTIYAGLVYSQRF
jgi:polysaccharide export outer membrane protein